MPSWNPASPVRKRAASTSAPARGANRVAVSSTAAAPGTRGSWPEHQEGDNHHGAPEDAEGVAADQAGLEAPAAAGAAADQLGDAVDGAVDAPLVDGPGQEGGQGPAQVDGEELVDLVHVQPFGQGPPGPGVAAPQGQPVDPPAVQQPGPD